MSQDMLYPMFTTFCTRLVVGRLSKDSPAGAVMEGLFLASEIATYTCLDASFHAVSGGVIVGNTSTPHPSGAAATAVAAGAAAAAAAAANSSLMSACKMCDRTSDQCVKASKCDATTNYECVPIYEDDYAICQKADAEVNEQARQFLQVAGYIIGWLCVCACMSV